MTSRHVVLALGMTLLGGLSCSSKKATAIVVAVSTEGAVPTDIGRLQVTVSRSGGSGFDDTYRLPDDAQLPGTLTVSNDSDTDVSSPVSIVVEGVSPDGSKIKILRRATLGFVDQETKLLRMPLRFSCANNPESCTDGRVCVGGSCVAPQIDPATLPTFVDGTVFYFAPGEGGCFDQARCLAGATPLLVDTSDPTTCTAAVPSGNYNLLMTWAVAPGSPVVVEQDAVEGYTVRAGRATFAPGLCKALKDPTRVTAVGISTACPPKVPDAPICVPSPISATLTPMAPDTTGATIQPHSFSGSPAFRVDDLSTSQTPFPPTLPALPAGSEQAGDVYQFSPHGVTFDPAAKIRVKYAKIAAGYELLSLEEGQKAWAPVASTKESGTPFVDASVSQFSYFVVAVPSSSGVGGQGGAGGNDPFGAGGQGGNAGDGGSSGKGGSSGMGGTSGSTGGGGNGGSSGTGGSPGSFGMGGTSGIGGTAGSSGASGMSGAGGAPTCGDTTGDAKNCGLCGNVCESGICDASLCAPKVIVQEQVSAYAVAQYNGTVYWCGVDKTPDTFGIYSAPADGSGKTTTLVDSLTDYCWSVFADKNGVYWFPESSSSIFSAPLGGLSSGQSGTVVTSGVVPTSPVILASGSFYYATGSALETVPTTGGTPATVVSGETFLGLTTDGTSLFWEDSVIGVLSIPVNGPPMPSIVLDRLDVTAMLVEKNNLFFVTSGGVVEQATLGAPADQVATILSQGDGIGSGISAGMLQSDGQYLYWTELDSVSQGEGTIRRAPVGGGDAALVVRTFNSANSNQFAMDASYLYLTSAVAPTRLPKSEIVTPQPTSTATPCGAAGSATEASRDCGFCGHNCFGAVCQSGSCGPLPTDVVNAVVGYAISGTGGVVVEGGYVYFSENDATNGTVKRVKQGSTVVETLATMQAYNQNLVTDHKGLYWIQSFSASTTFAWSFPFDGQPSPVSLPSIPNGIAADGSGAYVTIGGANAAIYRLEPKTGSGVLIAPAKDEPNHIAVGGGKVFFSTKSSPAVYAVDATGGSPMAITSTLVGPDVLVATDGVNVYAVDGTVVYSGSSGTTKMTMLATLPSTAVELTTDGVSLYVTTTTGDVQILKLPVSGGTPVTVVAGSSPTSEIFAAALDLSTLYFYDTNTRTIRSTAK